MTDLLYLVCVCVCFLLLALPEQLVLTSLSQESTCQQDQPMSSNMRSRLADRFEKSESLSHARIPALPSHSLPFPCCMSS